MGKVVGLRQHQIQELAVELANRLQAEGGSVRASISDLPVDVETWRAAGRRAGRILGWSVRTFVNEVTDAVWLVDNRADDEVPLPERRRRELAVRKVVRSIDYS